MKCPTCHRERPELIGIHALSDILDGVHFVLSPYLPDGYVLVGKQLFRMLQDGRVEEIDPERMQKAIDMVKGVYPIMQGDQS